MKNLSTVFSALAIVGGIAFLTSCTDNKKSTGSTTEITPHTGGVSIAYVNIDSLEANYTYLKNEKLKFEQRQAGMRAELERSAEQLRNDYANAQRKMQAGTMTEAEAQSTEKRLMQMQESLKTRGEVLEVQLMKEQDEFNKKLQEQLDKVLEDYNKDKKYDFILSYAKGGSIMYANKSLDITQDVLKAMNEDSKKLVEDAEKKNK